MLKRYISIVLLVLTPFVANARWASLDDADVEFLQYNQNITIHADGSAETIRDIRIKILNEQGREQLATLPLRYNRDNTTIEIITAKLVVDGQEYGLGPELIEDKPLASAAEGFDQQHQILLAFPQTKIGAVIELKIKQVNFNPTIPGLFETIIDFGTKYLQQAQININSEIPVYVKLNDPDHVFKLKNSKAKNTYQVQVTLTKPFYKDIMNEPHAVPSFAQLPWLYVSTTNDWTKISKNLTAGYEKVIHEELPPLYQSILAAAKKQTEPLKQINIVTSMLNESVKYMGDWRTNQGKMFPQSLAAVAKRRLGDCKDFATGTAAILNKLGIEANVALVYRGEGMYDISALSLPGLNHFNHAIVEAKIADTIYWIDPTNMFSVSDHVLPDIADREALVLNPNKPGLQKIPELSPEDSVLTIKRELDLSNPELVTIAGDFNLQGLSAARYTGYELYNSKETLYTKLLHQLGNFDNITEKSIQAPELKSRIVQDLDFTFKFKERNKTLNTNAGLAVLIGNPIDRSFVFSDERVAGVSTGGVGTLRTITILKNVKAPNLRNLNCDIKSPWVDAKREVVYFANSVNITQEFKIKRSNFSNETISSAEYKKVAHDLEANFNDGVAIVFGR